MAVTVEESMVAKRSRGEATDPIPVEEVHSLISSKEEAVSVSLHHCLGE